MIGVKKETLPVGTIILCSVCNHNLYELTNEMNIGDDVNSSLLRNIAPQGKIKKANKEKCHHCKLLVGYNKFRLPDGTILLYRMGELVQAQ